MISITDKRNCCGCSACASICGQHAIKLISDNEGFLYPIVDEAKCIECGLCEKVCPFGKAYDYTPDNTPVFYATYDVFNRVGSSSGGIFYTLSEYTIKDRKGWVFGASFDDSMKLHHVGVHTMNEIAPLRGSKYVQSDLTGVFVQVKKLLNEGEFVFFVGTPCQIAGLRSFLRKDYDNLLLADLVCHGVPSQLMFDIHKHYIENKYKSKIVRYQFRDNEGWCGCEIIDFDNHSQIKNRSYALSPFLYSFMQGYTCRESCYNCPFSIIPRQGDITLGDYWGVRNVFPKMDTSKGVSLVIVNTKKGKSIWDEVRKPLLCYQSSIEDATKENQNLIEQTKRPSLRSGIYDRINSEGYDNIVKKEFKHPNYKRIWLVNTLRNILPDSILKRVKNYQMKKTESKKITASLITIHTGFNFGSVLQTVATTRFLSDLGIDTTVVNYIQPNYTYRHYFKGLFASVRSFLFTILGIPYVVLNNIIYGKYLKKYCVLSKPIYKKDSFEKRCPRSDYYVTGSDQVWNTNYNGVDMRYFFSGIEGTKIAFSSSIGKDTIDTETAQMLVDGLKDYKAISVREKSAVDILASLGFKSELVLDPTFILNKKDWDQYGTKIHPKQEYILMYLPYNIKDKDLIYRTAKKIAEKDNLKIYTFAWGVRSEKYADKTFHFCSPGDFLSLMIHAKYIITNSFHGTAFSINLNKQFWVYMPSAFSTRIESVLSHFALEDRLLNSIIDDEQLSMTINYDIVNDILDTERSRTCKFIVDAITQDN